MQVKLMEYNILNGFCRRDLLKRYAMKPNRLEAALKVVKLFNPDLLVLCEASITSAHLKSLGEFGDDERTDYYAEVFGYPHSFYGIKRLKTKGKNHLTESGSTILSKFPLEGENYSLEKISFIRTTFNLGEKKVMLDVHHPHPRIPQDDKMRFIKSILRDRKSPYILAGDFNSISPQDEYNRGKLLSGFKKMITNPRENPVTIVNEILERKAITAVLEAGLTDSYRAIHPELDFVYTNPTTLLRKQSDTAMRLDYIFCSRDIKVLDAGIIKNELTDKASDHYPIYAILGI